MPASKKRETKPASRDEFDLEDYVRRSTAASSVPLKVESWRTIARIVPLLKDWGDRRDEPRD